MPRQISAEYRNHDDPVQLYGDVVSADLTSVGQQLAIAKRQQRIRLESAGTGSAEIAFLIPRLGFDICTAAFGGLITQWLRARPRADGDTTPVVPPERYAPLPLEILHFAGNIAVPIIDASDVIREELAHSPTGIKFLLRWEKDYIDYQRALVAVGRRPSHLPVAYDRFRETIVPAAIGQAFSYSLLLQHHRTRTVLREVAPERQADAIRAVARRSPEIFTRQAMLHGPDDVALQIKMGMWRPDGLIGLPTERGSLAMLEARDRGPLGFRWSRTMDTSVRPVSAESGLGCPVRHRVAGEPSLINYLRLSGLRPQAADPLITALVAGTRTW
ncbi:hypothetical protein [Nocardia heshunensis]